MYFILKDTQRFSAISRCQHMVWHLRTLALSPRKVTTDKWCKQTLFFSAADSGVWVM